MAGSKREWGDGSCLGGGVALALRAAGARLAAHNNAALAFIASVEDARGGWAALAYDDDVNALGGGRGGSDAALDALGAGWDEKGRGRQLRAVGRAALLLSPGAAGGAGAPPPGGALLRLNVVMGSSGEAARAAAALAAAPALLPLGEAAALAAALQGQGNATAGGSSGVKLLGNRSAAPVAVALRRVRPFWRDRGAPDSALSGAAPPPAARAQQELLAQLLGALCGAALCLFSGVAIARRRRRAKVAAEAARWERAATEMFLREGAKWDAADAEAASAEEVPGEGGGGSARAASPHAAPGAAPSPATATRASEPQALTVHSGGSEAGALDALTLDAAPSSPRPPALLGAPRGQRLGQERPAAEGRQRQQPPQQQQPPQHRARSLPLQRTARHLLHDGDGGVEGVHALLPQPSQRAPLPAPPPQQQQQQRHGALLRPPLPQQPLRVPHPLPRALPRLRPAAPLHAPLHPSSALSQDGGGGGGGGGLAGRGDAGADLVGRALALSHASRARARAGGAPAAAPAGAEPPAGAPRLWHADLRAEGLWVLPSAARR